MNIARVQQAMLKKASAVDDILGSVGSVALSPLTAGATGAANFVGGIAGLIQKAPTDEELMKMDRERGWSYVPGVAGNRLNRRYKKQLVNDKGSAAPRLWSHLLGPATAALTTIGAATLAGGLIGGATNGFKTDENALVGAGIGAGLGLTGWGLTEGVISPLAALLKPRRTKEEQRAAANSSTLKQWFVPGTAQYDFWKSMGRAIGDSEDNDVKLEKENEAKATV